MANPKPKKQNEAGQNSYLKITLSLLLICTVCAALLGAAYLVTASPIAENEKTAVNSILESLFDASCTFQSVDVPTGENAVAAWRVLSENQTLKGYAVRVVSAGFSDDIDFLVAFDASTSITGIEIISISETSGLGSRVGESSYLEHYNGLTGTELTLGKDVDAISGATKSSRALLRGVNDALGCVAALAN